MGQTNVLKQVWKGTILLTLAGFVVKLLSALYRVPFQNMVGDIGLYVYQQVYPFYGIAMAMAVYGFPGAISKITAETDSKKRRDVITTAFIILSCISIIVCLSIFFGAQAIASWMGDIQLVPVIRISSFVYLILPFVAVIRGYFQGMYNMKPTAVSQMVEQSIRVFMILVFASILIRAGYNVYDVAAVAYTGSVIGGLAALFILIMYLHKYKLLYFRKSINSLPYKMVLKVLFKEGFAISLFTMLLLLLQLVDSFTLVSILSKNGMDQESARAWKGVYDRGLPLIQLGTVAATSIAMTLVPLIAVVRNKRQSKLVHNHVSLTLRYTIVIGAAASTGLIAVMRPTNTMLYENYSGTDVLQILSLTVLFSSIAMTTAAILHGHGVFRLPFLSFTTGVIVKLLFNIVLIPIFDTMGAAISTVSACAIIALINVISIKKYGYKIHISWEFLWRLSSALLIMALAVILLFSGANFIFEYSRWTATAQAILGSILGGWLFLFVIIKLRLFSNEELQFLPFSSKLAAITGMKKY
ncbi:polysaccharide biosynthesis protein [Bacillus sp. HMF5848]|uniref:putative polysaccharide biosynthesis protein n=1 Tax=Bacillus sp. HMF5848 TaxID=2495421 RepID=UPI000F7759D3|nr:polysaccharide biosynthesis protein [Bacillus sp. HMF5848]RSK25491.1 polysaccharide biosynthesis protein [Bacillus sp. HMF5848]